jgi:hypothetical protein
MFPLLSDRIFTFWEPKGQLFPYLELCRKTWDINLPGYEIITLDYSNMAEYLDPDVYDWSALRLLSLPMQKDALMVAVLKEHGGVFMDLDTLVLADIAPLIEKTQKSEVVMLGSHMAFIAARPNSLVLADWLSRIQKKLSLLKNREIEEKISWDFIGNGILTEVMDELIKQRSPERFFHPFFLKNRNSSLVKRSGDAFGSKLYGKRRSFHFRTSLKKYLYMLDRNNYAFIIEALLAPGTALTATERYVKYWFEENRSVEDIFTLNPILIGLHNSWTPEWYKKLSRNEVLENTCTLSNTIQAILEHNMPL